MAVGVTHWEEFGAGAGELPGPTPAFFFAPDRVTKRSEDWGARRARARVADAWHPFCEWIGGWLEVIHGQGFEAVESAYLDVLEGRVDPKTAHVLTLPAGTYRRLMRRVVKTIPVRPLRVALWCTAAAPCDWALVAGMAMDKDPSQTLQPATTPALLEAADLRIGGYVSIAMFAAGATLLPAIALPIHDRWSRPQ